jgi:NhaP-type Na+/H+ or K+/H+ antiporter
MEIGFTTAVLTFGALLWVAAMLSGVMKGTVLSISVLSVAAGVAMAELGVVDVDPTGSALRHIAEVTLILTLFADGLTVERELLRRHWDSPARALAIAMPITVVLIAIGARLLSVPIAWQEAFLLASILAPTDPVVSAVVVTSPDVPVRVRNALNLESGLNDGLALPLVLFFLVLSAPGGDAGIEAVRLVGEALAGAVIGGGLGYLAGRLHPRLPLGGLTEHYTGIFTLGLSLTVYGVAELTIGNGLIAAFCCGIGLALAEDEGVPTEFSAFSEFSSSVAQVVTFFMLGALIVATGFSLPWWQLVAMVLVVFAVARPIAVYIASAGAGLKPRERAFIAWFGPKGVASMLFALLVLNSAVPRAGVIFDVAAFVVLASIATHGLTDTVAARRVFAEPEEEVPVEEEPEDEEPEPDADAAPCQPADGSG